MTIYMNLNFLKSFVDSDIVSQKGYSSMLSFTVTDINSSVTKLMALGAELDGPIKYEIHGKVIVTFMHCKGTSKKEVTSNMPCSHEITEYAGCCIALH